MKAVVKQDFDYSSDGLTLRRLKVGEIHEISESLFPGLRDLKLVSEAPASDPAPVPAPEPEPEPKPEPVKATPPIPPAPKPAALRTDNVPQQPKRFEDKRRRP